MGNEKGLQRQQAEEQVAPREIVPEVGRQTLVQQQQQSPSGPIPTTPIGNEYVDQGPACDSKMSTAHCFLNPGQRARLATGFKDRCLAAQMQYILALEKLRVNELLKKEPEKSDIFVDLLIEVIATVAVPALGRAVSLLRSGAAKAVWEYADKSLGTQGAGRLAAAMRSDAGTKDINDIIKAAVGKGKKAVQDAAKGPDPEEHDKKTANIAFLAILTDQSATIYQDIRENGVAGADDAQLAILFQAFDAAMGHTVGAYEEALKSKLARFEKSGVGAIGVTDGENDPIGMKRTQNGMPSFARNAHFTGSPLTYIQNETRVFRVHTPAGPRLGLYRRDYYQVPSVSVEQGGDRNLSPQEIAQYHLENARRSYVFVRYVPIEFESVASAMHTTQWGSEPLDRQATTPEEIAEARVTL